MTLRFPRRSEFRLSETAPKVGETLLRNGDSWVVQDVESAEDGSIVVTLRPAPMRPRSSV